MSEMDELTDKMENVVLREDPDELVKEKPKRTMTPEALEKLALARKKAMEAKKRLNADKKKKEKELKPMKEKVMKEHEDKLNDKPPPLKKSPRIKQPEPEPEFTNTNLGETTSDSDSEEEEVVLKKKPKKKPVVIVEESSDSEDDSNVVYIKRKSKKTKEHSLPPVPVYIPAPKAPEPVVDYAQLMRPHYARRPF